MTTADTFALTIRLGNDAMQTGADVAEQLHRAADYLADYYDALEADTALSILDTNGNRVGEWRTAAAERQESAEQIAADAVESITGPGESTPLSVTPDQLRAVIAEAVRAARGEA